MTVAETINSRTSPTFIIPVGLALFVALGFGPNSFLALLSCVLLVIGVHLLWRPGEPPILLFLFAFQWLQASINVFYANVRGETLAQFMIHFPGVEYATTLTLTGILFLTLGIRMGVGRQRAVNLGRMRDIIYRFPQRKWLQLHILAWVVSTFSFVLAAVEPGLSQPLLALANFKWATFTILTIVSFARPGSSRLIWLGVFCVELVLSLGGYFSSFKFVFLYTLIALGAVSMRISLRQLATGLLITVAMLALALYWTVIKSDYRYFVSGGQTAQVVVVSKLDAARNMVALMADVDGDQLVKAASDLVQRFSEIDIFSGVVQYVPSVIEHEWGALWLDALSRPFMPRILFPDKTVLDDSTMTNYYTGLNYAGVEQGTQVSMGYIADSYIDFGQLGMMAALCAFGYFLGYIYRLIIWHRNAYGLLGAGLVSATLMQATSIGISSAKMFGGILVSVFVCLLFLRMFAPRLLRWLEH